MTKPLSQEQKCNYDQTNLYLSYVYNVTNTLLQVKLWTYSYSSTKSKYVVFFVLFFYLLFMPVLIFQNFGSTKNWYFWFRKVFSIADSTANIVCKSKKRMKILLLRIFMLIKISKVFSTRQKKIGNREKIDLKGMHQV